MSSYLIDEKKNLVQPSGLTFTKKTLTFAPGELFVARWDNETNSSVTTHDDHGKVFDFISSCDLSKFAGGVIISANSSINCVGKVNSIIYNDTNAVIEMIINPNTVYKYTGYPYDYTFKSVQQYIVDNLMTGSESLIDLNLMVFQQIETMLTLYFEE